MWSDSCKVLGTTSESLTDRPCRQLTIRNVKMSHNTAEAAGGAMFASDADQVHYSTEVKNLNHSLHNDLLPEQQLRGLQLPENVRNGGNQSDIEKSS